MTSTNAPSGWLSSWAPKVTAAGLLLLAAPRLMTGLMVLDSHTPLEMPWFASMTYIVAAGTGILISLAMLVIAEQLTLHGWDAILGGSWLAAGVVVVFLSSWGMVSVLTGLPAEDALLSFAERRPLWLAVLSIIAVVEILGFAVCRGAARDSQVHALIDGLEARVEEIAAERNAAQGSVGALLEEVQALKARLVGDADIDDAPRVEVCCSFCEWRVEHDTEESGRRALRSHIAARHPA